jgi:hypothetical protein
MAATASGGSLDLTPASRSSRQGSSSKPRYAVSSVMAAASSTVLSAPAMLVKALEAYAERVYGPEVAQLGLYEVVTRSVLVHVRIEFNRDITFAVDVMIGLKFDFLGPSSCPLPIIASAFSTCRKRSQRTN